MCALAEGSISRSIFRLEPVLITRTFQLRTDWSDRPDRTDEKRPLYCQDMFARYQLHSELLINETVLFLLPGLTEKGKVGRCSNVEFLIQLEPLLIS